MSTSSIHRSRRAKVFGDGRCVPLSRKAKLRVWKEAQKFLKPTEKGEHYGRLTPKYLEVLRVLLWEFHNAITGRCFPSYEASWRRPPSDRARRSLRRCRRSRMSAS